MIDNCDRAVAVDDRLVVRDELVTHYSSDD